MNEPLSGLKVVELHAIGPVPFGGQVLRSLGADHVLNSRSSAFADTSSLSLLMYVEDNHCADASSGYDFRISAFTRAMN